MRISSPSRMKGSNTGKVLKLLPSPGTKLRALYDELYANRGHIITIASDKNGYPRSQIVQLCNYYDCDIRHVSKYQWVLAGEYYGKIYIDYIAETQPAKQGA